MGSRTCTKLNSSISAVTPQNIKHRILLMRGERVILDVDLALLYGVETRHLNQQVKRNKERFPEDFMFQLTASEKAEVITNCDNLANTRYYRGLPYAFAEHGAIMAASVLNTPRAIEMSVFVVRAFVRLKRFLSTHKELAEKLHELEQKLANHDQQIVAIIEAIKQLMAPREHPDPRAAPDKRRIGFQRGEDA